MHLHKYHKLGWMILGLIAPELVVWNAWEQRKEMKKISKMMQEKGFMLEKLTLWQRVRSVTVEVWQWALTGLLLRAENLPEFAEAAPYKKYNGRTYPWTDAHSWFVVMGGMSFEDSAEEDQQFMPENRHRINITAEGFKYLLEMRDHLIPDISQEYIQDKSKSDRLAKLLTCWQAGYFCIQCVFRLSQQLAITLLELNVFAHAICALALFVIWSHKPRDVCEPTLIVGEEAMDICALLCLHVVNGENEFLHGYRIVRSPPPWSPDESLEIAQPTSFAFHHMREGSVYYGGIGSVRFLKVLDTYWILVHDPMPYYSMYFVTLNARDLRRLQRASKFIQRERSRFPGLKCIYPDDMPDVYACRNIARTDNSSFNTDSHLNHEETGLSKYRPYRFAWYAAGMTFAGLCYGGLHLIAWETPFASPLESVLWRAASVGIMAFGPLFIVLQICFYISTEDVFYRGFETEDSEVRSFSAGSFSAGSFETGSFGNSRRNSCGTWLAKIQVIGLVGMALRSIFKHSAYLLVLWYTFCRAFIIVESFIMLAHLPEQVLQVPTWSAYIPHIV